MDEIRVPVKSNDGSQKLEPFNPEGKQSDGSQYHIPQPLVPDDHEHFYELKNPTDRHVICSCGHGGLFYPHNAELRDGHIYNKQGEKVA